MAHTVIGIFFQCQQSQSLETQPPFSPISLGLKRKPANNEITYFFSMAEITYSFFQWQKNDPDYTENTLIYLQPCKFNQANFPNKFRQRQNNLKICKGKALSSLSSVTGLT